MQGPILSHVPAPTQHQCSLKVRQQIFPYVEEASMTVHPPPQQLLPSDPMDFGASCNASQSSKNILVPSDVL